MAQPSRKLDGIVRLGIGHDHRELIATGSEESVGLTEGLAHLARQTGQETIALGVAVPVIDGLEIVQVDKQERERHAVTLEEPELAGELLVERAVVAHRGEAVVE